MHFDGWVTGGMLPKFWYPCTLQTPGECCPNFDIDFMAWAFPGTPKNNPKSIKNQQKLVLGVALGTPGLPLEASWVPLGGRIQKTIKKVSRGTSPRRSQRRSFLNIFPYFLGYCFWYQFLYNFWLLFGALGTPNIWVSLQRGCKNQVFGHIRFFVVWGTILEVILVVFGSWVVFF